MTYLPERAHSDCSSLGGQYLVYIDLWRNPRFKKHRSSGFPEKTELGTMMWLLPPCCWLTYHPASAPHGEMPGPQPGTEPSSRNFPSHWCTESSSGTGNPGEKQREEPGTWIGKIILGSDPAHTSLHLPSRQRRPGRTRSRHHRQSRPKKMHQSK